MLLALAFLKGFVVNKKSSQAYPLISKLALREGPLEAALVQALDIHETC